MPAAFARITRTLFLAAACVLAASQLSAQEAGSRQLAPGFDSRPAASKLVVMPVDIETFSISAGGLVEPRADWTEAAQKHFGDALVAARGQRLGANTTQLANADDDELAEVVTLHRAVADAITLHHTGGVKLATKRGKLEWTLGEAVRPLKAKTGADYALFTWIRDSYTSSERKAAMLAMALLGAISFGGDQVGYASLVDLNTGRVVWFNGIDRMTGDLREPGPARETLDALLKGFPPLK